MDVDSARIELRAITADNFDAVIALQVADEQCDFVPPAVESIAWAYVAPECHPLAIYAGDTPVGFVMLSDDPAGGRYYLWRFMIDARYQRGGIGRRALELLFEHVRGRPGAKLLYTSCVPGEGSPGPFYEKMGFVYTGEEDEGELVMRREL